MLDFSLITVAERLEYIKTHPKAATPELMADYILNADDNTIARPENKHTYWKKRDDRNQSFEALPPNSNFSTLGANYFILSKPQRKKLVQNSTIEQEIERLQQRLLCSTPGTKEYAAIRHLLISQRRNAYIAADSENPIIQSKVALQFDFEFAEKEPDFSVIDLTRPLHLKLLYENWGTLEHCEHLDAQAIKHKLLVAEQRTPLIPWQRQLLEFKRQGFTFAEYENLLEPKRKQSYCVAVYSKLYPQLAATLELMEIEETALKNFNPKHWRYCKSCKQWYLDIPEYWRKMDKSKCKNCFARNKTAATGSGIFDIDVYLERREEPNVIISE